MGEIADMLLEGDLCNWCGVALECEGFGIPILCHDCHSEKEADCGKPVEGMLCENYYN